jgi:hypothetical protein
MITLDSSTILQPLTSAWLGKIQEAIRARSPFNDVAEQCMGFYRGACGFMWDAPFMKKYVGTIMAPTFKITIAKAFELVALFGPTLYWRNPQRVVKPRHSLQMDPAMFAGIDPTGALMQHFAQQQAMEQGVDKAVAGMLELYLNYTPTEQPGGGLANHASNAITEALVKGRGCIWPRPYFMPGSERVMTGCFYDSVDNLLIDPDATTLEEAKWIAQRCIQPVWEVERTFGLPKDSLRGKGSHESADAQGSRDTADWSQTDRRVGNTFDLITYYKVWSKGGAGFRLGGQQRVEEGLAEAMDEVIGDYGYIVVAPNVPYPLNCPAQFLHEASDSEIGQRFAWPAPYWQDDRWPVSVLDFYRAPNSPWPIAPLAPGLGELTMMNILISRMANHIWWNTRAMLGYNAQIGDDVERKLKSGEDVVTFSFKGQNEDPDKMLRFIPFPQMNKDYWQFYDQLSSSFDRRTGLSDLLYGMNPGGVQSRTAEDVATKREMVSIRPDYMAGKVEDWMAEVADMERICACKFVKGQDLRGNFGQVEQFVWQQFIEPSDTELIMRGMRASVAANSTRKPDKQRDVQNVNQLIPLAMPVMQGYFQATGQTQGINSLIGLWGKTMDQDTQSLMLPPLPPPQPEQDNADQLAQQAEEIQRQQLEEAHSQKLQHADDQHHQRLAHEHDNAVVKAQHAQLMGDIQARSAAQKAKQAGARKRQGAAA